MYCQKCGKKIEEDSTFCPHCGAEQIPDSHNRNASADNNTEGRERDRRSSGANRPRKGVSGKTIGLIVAIAVVVIAVVVIIIAASNSRVTIDMNKYLVVSESGYDGYGSVSCHVDYNQLYDDYAGKLKLTPEGNSNYLFSSAYIEGGDLIELIYDDLDAYADTSSDLSNGDKVVFSWDDSDVTMLETYIKVSIKTNDYEYTVSDLDEVETEDFFNYLSINFSGIAPDGTANISVDCDWLDEYDFSIDKTDGLSNGDVITATIDEYSLQDILYLFGKVPIETEKTYTVEGLNEYITSISQIPSEDLDKIKQKGEDKIDEIFNGDNDTINQITLLGYDLMKSGSRHESESCEIYAIYKINETIGRNDNFYTFDNYWYISFPDGYINGDGAFKIYYSKYFTPVIDSTNWWTGYVDSGEGWTYMSDDKGIVNLPGFQTLDELNSFIGAKGSSLLDSTVSE